METQVKYKYLIIVLKRSTSVNVLYVLYFLGREPVLVRINHIYLLCSLYYVLCS